MKIEHIENAIYEAIRLKIVEKGYLPDITEYEGNPAGFKTAMDAIVQSGKKLIYVENTGSYKARETLEENCIIIDNESINPSVTGTKSIPKYELNETEDRYNKSLTTDVLYDLEYRITIICYDYSYLQIMHDVLFEALQFRKKINAIDNEAVETGESFWLWRRNYVTLDSNKFIERATYYEVPSADIIGDTEDGSVARAEEISIGIYLDYEISEEKDDDIVIEM